MELEEEEKSVEKGGKGSGQEGSPLVEDHTAPDDREDKGDGKGTFFAPRKIDEPDDEDVVDDNLYCCKTTEIPDRLEEEGVNDGHQIEETDEIVEVIGERDKKRSLF